MPQSLTLFYDGQCPLCATEIRHMMHRDRHQRIRFEDINAADFERRFPWLSRERAMQVLHGQRADGEMLFGLDVTVMAWSLLGKGHWVAWLRWPGIRVLADWAYRLFARYREPATRLWRRLGRRSDPAALSCDRCQTATAKSPRPTARGLTEPSGEPNNE